VQSTGHDGALAATPASAPVGQLIDVVVLTSDVGLLAALREASGPEHAIWHATTAEAAVDYLVGGRCGILVADLGTLRGDAAGLLASLHTQFPELVLLAAGRRDEESTVAALVSDGRIYRFLHKPVSPARAQLFLSAAARRYYEVRESEPPMLTTMRIVARRPRGLRAAVAALALIVIVGAAIVWRATSSTNAQRGAPESEQSAQEQVAELLGRANIALATGRLIEPRGDNALDLYREVLAVVPNHPEAAAGIARVVAALEAQVSAALAARDPQTGAAALAALRRAQPDHPRYAQFYDELISLSRSLAPASPARVTRRPTVRRNVEEDAAAWPSLSETAAESADSFADEEVDAPLIDTLDAATDEEAEPDSAALLAETESTETPEESAAHEDAREQLALAVRLRERGLLIDPPENNAFDRLLVLLAQHSHFIEVDVERQRLALALVEHARTHLAAGDLEQTELYLDKVARIAPDLASLRALRVQLETARAERERDRVVPAAALKRTREVRPEYPRDAQSRGIEGWVDVEFTIAADGTTRDLIVRDAEPRGIFDRSALEALRRWRFEPIVRDGRAVEQRATIRLHYRLAD